MDWHLRTAAGPSAGRRSTATLRLGEARSSAVALTVRLSADPGRALAVLVGVDVAACGAFAGLGAAAGDPVLAFRELGPASWMSLAQLLLVAAAAWAVHLEGPERRVRASFFGTAAVVFFVFAVDEALALTQFAGSALNHGLGMTPAGGFHDLDAVLLVLLFSVAGLVLLPRSLVLLRHPRALTLMAAAALLGVASQGLDSFVVPNGWPSVGEETLKLLAGATFVGAFLSVLRDVRAADARAPRP